MLTIEEFTKKHSINVGSHKMSNDVYVCVVDYHGKKFDTTIYSKKELELETILEVLSHDIVVAQTYTCNAEYGRVLTSLRDDPILVNRSFDSAVTSAQRLRQVLGVRLFGQLCALVLS